MIDEYIVEYDEYVGLGSGSFSYLDGNLFVNTFSLGEYEQAINAGRMAVSSMRKFGAVPQMQYRFMMQLFDLHLTRSQFRKDFGFPLELGLWKEMAFMYLVGALTNQGKDWVVPTARNRYLLVVGKDKEQGRYQQLAKTLNCEERVRFFGMQSETLPFYQMADGLLLPTLYDPFPNVILEAMACGLPVITTTGCGGAEFIVDCHNGYVCDALDIPALQQAVMALPARALGSAEGGHARERIMACTSERLSTQLLSLYQDLVK